MAQKGIPLCDDFVAQFKIVNEALWYQYDRGLIDSEVIRTERFKQILEPFHAYDAQLSSTLSKEYLDLCPKKGNLMPHALDILEYLMPRYKMAIITNGFEDTQYRKVSAGKLDRFFEQVITSEKAGHKKPSREIFQYALKLNSVECHDAIMIGDNLITDVGGAKNASIDPVFFNSIMREHNEILDHEIHSLYELRSIL